MCNNENSFNSLYLHTILLNSKTTLLAFCHHYKLAYDSEQKLALRKANN